MAHVQAITHYVAQYITFNLDTFEGVGWFFTAVAAAAAAVVWRWFRSMF